MGVQILRTAYRLARARSTTVPALLRELEADVRQMPAGRTVAIMDGSQLCALSDDDGRCTGTAAGTLVVEPVLAGVHLEPISISVCRRHLELAETDARGLSLDGAR